MTTSTLERPTTIIYETDPSRATESLRHPVTPQMACEIAGVARMLLELPGTVSDEEEEK